ncbi:MAG TPA: TfuA-like protein [Verrucomicrobiae bacterium]|nr:TfuA-like protein [Verrucomicrobiae bacterium]
MTGTVIVFALPGLAPPATAADMKFDFRPPAVMGDLYRAASEKPAAILLLNGVFENAPAVRHKEILWALSQGVPVFGAAGIGALRAVELAAHGMIGLGRIYDSYSAGLVVRDDAVAALYRLSGAAPVRASEPLVNIQATIAKAASAGIIAAATCRQLEAIAAALFFKHRTYDRLLAEAEAAGLDRREIDGLRAWIPCEATDLQRQDSELALAAISDRGAKSSGAPAIGFSLERTASWKKLCAEAEAGAALSFWHSASDGMVTIA